jgi:D-3-phosphoglycerate dehydrogenase
MRLLGYDPFVSAEYAASLGVEIMSMDALLSNSDFLTIHIPLSDTTRALIGEPEFKKMKPGARLINVARGGLVDEDALAEALEDGRLAGAALDVFAAEPPRESPLLGHPRVVVTPHLGGSTEEAQREVAVEVAEQVLAVLRGQPARTAVNAPFVSPEVNRVVAPFVPVAELVGKLVTHLAEGQFESIELGFEGEIAEHDTALLRAAALTGLLSPTTSERINEINANLTAQRRGLRVSERKGSRAQEYGSLLTLTLYTTLGDTTIAGTSMRGEPHVVRVNQYWLDLIPSVPYLVFIEHGDMPGMIGAVGTITGRNDVNIAFMEVGRLDIRGKAMMVLGLDDPVNARVLEEIKAVPHIDVAKVVRL